MTHLCTDFPHNPVSLLTRTDNRLCPGTNKYVHKTHSISQQTAYQFSEAGVSYKGQTHRFREALTKFWVHSKKTA